MAYPYMGYTPAYGPGIPAYGTGPVQPMMPSQPAQPVQPVPQPAQGLSNASRPVTSKEEALGIAADFSGALMLFPDITHNRVYIKRWNLQTGSAEFGEFAPIPPAAQENQQEQQNMTFASLQDFQDLKDLVDRLQAEISTLKKPTGKAVKKNDADEQ